MQTATLSIPSNWCMRIEALDQMGNIDQTIVSSNLPLVQTTVVGKTVWENYTYPDGTVIEIQYSYWDLIQFSDQTGIIYSARNKRRFWFNGLIGINVFRFFANEPCNETELLCRSDNYPGFVCKPIAPIANSIQRMNERVR